MATKSTLFKFSTPEHLNACISTSFESYGYLYKESAWLFHNLLICANIKEDLEHLSKTHLFKLDEKHPVTANVDYIIPVIFLYRHSIELNLKSLYLTLKSKECIDSNTEPDRAKIIEKISKCIADLNFFDPDSMAFRYPYSNKVNNNEFDENLKEITHINLLVFYKEINKLCDYLEDIDYYFQGEYEFYDRILYTTESSYFKSINKK